MPYPDAPPDPELEKEKQTKLARIKFLAARLIELVEHSEPDNPAWWEVLEDIQKRIGNASTSSAPNIVIKYLGGDDRSNVEDLARNLDEHLRRAIGG